MRILICLLALAVTLTCCKSNKRMIRSEVGYVSTQPVEVAVQEKVQDTLVVEEEPVTVKKEKVGLTDGADLMRYCIREFYLPAECDQLAVGPDAPRIFGLFDYAE